MGDFEETGYAVLTGLIDSAEREALLAYVLHPARHQRLDDPQVPNTPSKYADPVMEALLARLLPKIEAATGRSLFPTCSYYRIYKRGDALEKHTDREACELSVSLSIGYDAQTPWPLWVESKGEPKAMSLSPGDGLLYKGIDVPHWREPFDGERAVQVFLHYVDKLGPHAEWRYDRREALNIGQRA